MLFSDYLGTGHYLCRGEGMGEKWGAGLFYISKEGGNCFFLV